MTSHEGEVPHRTLSRIPTYGNNPGEIDPTDLPLGQVNDDANLEEYIVETRTGNIIKSVKSNVTDKMEDWKLVTFRIDDPENPKNWSKARKWYYTMVVAWTCFVVAFASAVVTAGLEGPSKDFHVSEEVSLLTVTVFVIGFGVGKTYLFQYCIALSFKNQTNLRIQKVQWCSLPYPK
jgi:hypothetical protein